MLFSVLNSWKRRANVRWPLGRSRRHSRRRFPRPAAIVEQLESRVLLSAVSGTVFEDADGDGAQNGGEPGMPGVTVYLDANDNGVFDDGELSAMTDNAGDYGFANLAAGSYIVRQIVPENFEQTSPLAGPGRLFATTFFGTHRVQELDPADGSVLNEFPLPNQQANFTQGLAFDGETLFYYENNAKTLYELDPDTGAVLDSTSLAVQFANRNIGGLAALGERVYMLDVTSNANRAMLVFDPVADQVTNTFSLGQLDVEGGFAALPGENLLVTASNGEFLFLNPANGNVVETVDYDATISNTTVSGLAAIDGNIYLTAGGRITDVIARDGSLIRSFINPVESGGMAGGSASDDAHRVALDGVENVDGLHFGNRSLLGRITGMKFEDVNGNGVRDDGEAGLAGVVIYLDQNRNGVFDDGDTSTTTAGDGTYALEVAAGVHTVREVVPEDFVQTGPVVDDDFYYAISRAFTGAPGNLIRIDAATGEVITIGPHLTGRNLNGLVRTYDGSLFAISGEGTGNDAFYSIDPETGQSTFIGNTGREVGFGLAYDSATDTIYGVGQISQGVRGLLTYDRVTGAANPVSTTGMSQPSSTSGIAFDPIGNRVLVYNFADGVIYEFDPATGAGSLLSDAPNGMGVNLAFVSDRLVMKRDFNGPANEFLAIDPDTGGVSSLFFASQGFVAEALDYVDLPDFAHVVRVQPRQTVSGVDFGNQRLNDPPTADAGGPYAIDEGNGVVLDASASSDPDGDALSYAWDLDNDGQFDDAAGAVVAVSWQQLLTFGIGDDGVFPVAVRVSDGEFADDASSSLTVENVDPILASVSTTAGAVGDAGTGETVSLMAEFTDAGTLDTHVATIDWGDDTSSEGEIAGGTVAATHVYQQGGVYSVVVTVVDDDGGSDALAATAYVTGVGINGGVLQIVGTAAGDNVAITTHRRHGTEVRADFLPGRGIPVDLSLVSSIEVFLGGGDDRFAADGSVSLPLLVLGGTGNDRLSAGSGRSLLIGGLGADQLTGGADEDILIAGTTAFDHDPAALRSLIAEWSSTRTLKERVANLYDGSGSTDRLNGDHFLTFGENGTVQDDDDEDTLNGGKSTDWLFYDLDRDRTRGKLRDDIFGNDFGDLFDGM